MVGGPIGHGPSMPDLTALVLNCTLTSSPAPSSTELLATQIIEELGHHGVDSRLVRVVDRNVRFGVSTDEGDGDEWPALREGMLAADILVLVTPIWMGQPSSVSKMVLERLDAELAETDDEGRLLTYGKVAAVGVVGNEDGAHHTIAELFQGLNDVGFTVAAAAATYWVGEAMHTVDYRDLDERPEKTASATRALAANTAHLAALLKNAPYPPAS